MKNIKIITGHYGSGKTNFSVNLAVKAAAEGKSAAIVDLDIVNPYFRTADFKDLFEKKGIRLIAPDFARSNLDIPSIQFDVVELATDEDCLIIDVGGDDAGATALGVYSRQLADSEPDVLYVINRYRSLTTTPEEAVEILREIESTARIRATALVNNSHLKQRTDAKVIEDSIPFAE